MRYREQVSDFVFKSKHVSWTDEFRMLSMPGKSFALVLGLVMATPAFGQEWSIAISGYETEDRSIIFRSVSEFPSGFDRAKQPERLTVVWDYESERGMPSLEVRQRMDEVEETHPPVIESDVLSTLALVST